MARVRRFPLTIAAAAGILFAMAPPQDARAQKPPNVLLVTIDTVRADRIGAYGYTKGATPVMDRLARDGVRFADATTQSPLTGPAHAALLTGQYPARLGIRDNATAPLPPGTPTVASLFKARGYRTGGFVAAFILGREYGFAQGFDTFDASFAPFASGSKLQAQRRGGDVVDAAITWLRGAPSTVEGPFFAWVHLYDAHTPYEPPAPFRARFAASPYDGEIAYVDAAIGRLIATLEQSGQLDATLVAVVADHGEGLGDHGEAEHGFFLYESVLHIPWIMRLPAREAAGTVVRTQVRAIDVTPTLAAVAGIPMRGIDGESVVPFIRGTAPRDPSPSYAETFYPRWHFGWSELKSVRVGDWKYVDAPKPELYDMRSDRAETKNAVGGRGPLANGLASELKKIESGFGRAATTEAPQPDAETLARLRSLGYVGIASPASGARGADPKDMVAPMETFRRAISRAMDALDRNAPDAAIAELQKGAAVNERSYELHLFLGDAYAAKRQFDRALGEYDAAAVLYPRSAAPAASQARIFLAAGDVVNAQKKIDAAAALEPASSEVAGIRAEIFERQGRAADAVAQYEKAVRANPSDARARASLAALALQTRQYDLAKQHFEILLRDGYRPSRMQFGLAQIAEAAGDRAGAVAKYREAVRLEPGFSQAKAALQRLGAQ